MNRTFFRFLILCFLITSTILVDAKEFAKTKNNPPNCSNSGAIFCPNGYQPSCPKSYQPSCVFLGTMQLPACLADNVDNKVFSYDLKSVGCQKNK